MGVAGGGKGTSYAPKWMRVTKRSPRPNYRPLHVNSEQSKTHFALAKD